MMVLSNLNKDKCEVCKGLIMKQSKIMTCNGCTKVVHGKCAKSLFVYDHIENTWMCFDCSNSKLKRYNIFSKNCYDKHDPNNLYDVDDLHELSKILNNCKNYDVKGFNGFTKTINTDNNIFSCLFNNIDGNASNFDQFASEILGQLKNCFSVVALTETNTNILHKDLYQLSNYISVYNEKYPGKRKGSGIGLYIHNQFIFNCMNKLSRCTKNMECLFVTITNTNVPITVGAVYRPPSGLVKNFLNEWEAILKELPKENVIVMGDFNIDLFKPNAEFEGVIYGNNMIPTITLATHEKPGCKPSLIDNILINTSESLLNAGILETRVSHHSPVFCYLNYNNSSDEETVTKCPKYDYCETNMNNFLSKLQILQDERYDAYDEATFVKFVEQFKNYCDECFKVEKDNFKKSRRNFYVNPWITPGIRACISKKLHHYKLWKKKKHMKCDQEIIDIHYERYKCYRRYLKKIIKVAKKIYYSKRFENVQGDLKKTWTLINELRGKVKQNIKASFIINGEVVEDRKLISNEFNKFFASTAKQLNAKICSSTLNHTKSCSDNFRCFLKNRINSSIFMSPATVNEIQEIIQNFSNDKASDVSIFVLKNVQMSYHGNLQDLSIILWIKDIFREY